MSLNSILNFILFGSIVNYLARRYPPQAQEIRLSSKSRVLVFTEGGFGDLLCNSVVFRALANAYPGIYLVGVPHQCRPYPLRRNPFISKIYLFRKGPFAFLNLWRQLHSDGPWDAIIYLNSSRAETRWLGYLLNRNVTMGTDYKTKWGYLCAYNMPEKEWKHMHLARRPLQIIKKTGICTSPLPMAYQIAEEDRSALTQRLNALCLPQNPEVIFQLGGGNGIFYRNWPIEYYVELAERLQKAGVSRIFILGGSDHLQKAAQFREKARQANVEFYDVVGKLSFYLSAALIERSQCLVSPDTGIMHLGLAIRKPTVLLLHCQHGSAQLAPVVDTHLHEVIEIPRPPHYRDPKDVSMSIIQPQEVLERVLAILQRQEKIKSH